MASITDQIEVIYVTIWHRWWAASGNAQSVYSDEPGEAGGGQTRKEEEKQTEEEERESMQLSQTAGDVQLSERLDYSLKSALWGRREGEGKSERNK